jgi:hypothetical protein
MRRAGGWLLIVSIVAVDVAALLQSDADESSPATQARAACRALDRGWVSAERRADAYNTETDLSQVAHPAHVGDDGFNRTEWAKFEAGERSVRVAARADSRYNQLADAFARVVKGKGLAGDFLLVPMTDAFDECFRLSFLPRP